MTTDRQLFALRKKIEKLMRKISRQVRASEAEREAAEAQLTQLFEAKAKVETQMRAKFIDMDE